MALHLGPDSSDVTWVEDCQVSGTRQGSIRDFRDHATFREKSVITGLVGQPKGYPLLTQNNNVDPIQFVKYDVFVKKLNMKRIYKISSFPFHLMMLEYLIF